MNWRASLPVADAKVGLDPDAPEDPAFEILWSHVLDNWQDDKAHVAFLEHCREHDRLLPAAKRYRALFDSDHHKAQAERRLEGITLLAMAKMEQARTSQAGAKRQAGRLVAIVFFVAAATGLLIFYSLR